VVGGHDGSDLGKHSPGRRWPPDGEPARPGERRIRNQCRTGPSWRR